MRSSPWMFTMSMLAGLALASISGLSACSSDSESGGPICTFSQLAPVAPAVTGTWCVDLNLAPEFPETCTAVLGQRPFESVPASDWEVSVNTNAVFVSVDGDGGLRIERGYVRPEDEAPAEPEADGEAPEGSEDDGDVQRTVITIGDDGSSTAVETAEEEDGIKPLPDRLLTELTAHRTLALRDALANDPDTAFVAVLHALCLNAFYRYVSETCLEITAKCASFGTQAPGLNDSMSAKAIEDRHAQWAGQLPKELGHLWNALIALDGDSRSALFAHCASLSVNAVHEPWNRNPSRIVHAGLVARAVGLDMVAAGWTPTVDTYLGRVTKARILEAVREAKGEASAQLIDHLKKPDMAKEAERLLAGSGWLPEPLRMPDAETAVDEPAATEDLPAFLDDEEGVSPDADPEEPQPPAIAAE